MGKLLKVEKRTKDFIAALEYLKKNKKMPTNLELARVLGVKNISTISEIKAERQNIQPASWENFKKEYNSDLPETFGQETEDPEGNYQKPDKKTNVESFLEIINRHSITIDKQADIIKRQEETIFFLTTKGGNAGGQAAHA